MQACPRSSSTGPPNHDRRRPGTWPSHSNGAYAITCKLVLDSFQLLISFFPDIRSGVFSGQSAHHDLTYPCIYSSALLFRRKLEYHYILAYVHPTLVVDTMAQVSLVRCTGTVPMMGFKGVPEVAH
jgi:hypothetical protein